MAHGDSAWVRRASAGWQVAVQPAIAALLRVEARPVGPPHAPYHLGDDDAVYAYDDYQAEIQAELMEEIEEDRDNWARSEEEGWFYGDE